MPENKITTKKDLHQEIKEKGWKQGSCLLVEDSNSFGLSPGLYIVLSQDCDLINTSLEKEPYIELVFVNEIEKTDGRCSGGKNPRKLHFCHQTKNYECQIKDRLFVDRNLLRITTPLCHLDNKTKNLLIDWVIKRYNRTAFPDNFNKRVTKKQKKEIDKLLQAHYSDIHDLYIQLSTFEELDDKRKYKINLFILVKDETDDKKISKIKDSLEEIIQILEECNICIENDYRVTRLSDISYGTVRSMYLWDFEYLSYY